MKNTTLIVSTLVGFATLGMSSIASGEVVGFNSRAAWDMYVAAQGASVATETFNSYNGFYASGLTGNAGGIQWTASAPGDLYAGSGFVSTNAPEALLTFNLSPSVQGVASNFFATDINFNVLPAIIGVQLADGSAYVGYAASAADFVGFYSTGAAIASISVSVADNLPAGSNYATVNNLYFAFKEYDTDGDGRPDASDNCPTIANPRQADCNGNGIGDACELAAGAPDCNTNTIPDSCELAAGTAFDCNTNTVLDSCDIAGGASDFNQDTIPDTCQCLADLFVDHQVNGADLGALLAFWGPVNSGFPQADVNRDGKVDGADLGYLLNAWGPCTN